MAANPFTGLTQVPIVTGVTPSATAITAYEVDANGHPDDTKPLTGTSQLSSTTVSWGNFIETTSIDSYNVYFFFSASSLNYTASTFELASNIYTGVSFSDVIYQIEENGAATDFYALKMTFPERYESAVGSDTYTVTVKLVTNDPETFLNTRLQVTHTYCKASETVETPQP